MARKTKQSRAPGLKVVWRNRIAYAVGTLPGVGRIRKSLRSTGKLQAAEECVALQAKLMAAAKDVSTKGPTFSEAAVAYIAHIDAINKRKREVRGHYEFPHRLYSQLIKKIGHMYICDITPGFLTDLSLEMLPNGEPAYRKRQVKTPVAATINFYADRGKCAPIRLARESKAAKSKRTFVVRGWIDKFRTAADELAKTAATPADAHKFRALGVAALMMYTTGARRQEITVFEAKHFNLDKRIAALPPEWMKNGEEGDFLLPQELVAELRTIMPEDGRVFGLANVNAIYDPWRKIIKRAGIPYVPPHQAGRHSFGTSVGQKVGKDLDVKTAAKLGRWKDPTVFLNTYVHAKDDLLQCVDDIFKTPTNGLKVVKGGKD